MTALRAASNSTTLARFLDESVALEATIENQLQSLADRESLVRNAAAKATSNIIMKLDASMAREVLEALFATLHDDLARDTLQTANAFAWHGVVLALSYALFKRSVPADQLPILIKILLKALTFEQRTATGSTTGTNVRDAANFGLWSLARRSTTSELSQIRLQDMGGSLIASIAVQLLQSACLDPVGNVRRGSSAALQELVGRHPDQVGHGIALVQVVDFVAVGLRRRAMTDVAASAMALDKLYLDALIDGLTGWRGLGASDIASREFAAASLVARAAHADEDGVLHILTQLLASLKRCQRHDIEQLHGLALTFALWIDDQTENIPSVFDEEQLIRQLRRIWDATMAIGIFDNPFEHRTVRTNLGLALIKLITAYCKFDHANYTTGETAPDLGDMLPALLHQLLTRSDDRFLQITTELVPVLLPADFSPSIYTCLELPRLVEHLEVDITKPSQHGAARVMAVGASITHLLSHADTAQHIMALHMVCQSSHIDWRIIGFKGTHICISRVTGRRAINGDNLQLLVNMIINGFRDFTIDQRGDVGSLVRLEALKCARTLCTAKEFEQHQAILADLHAGIARLSLEKLNRVRASAAQCRTQLTGPLATPTYDEEVDSEEYFTRALGPLWAADSPPWVKKALIAGTPSCAGSAAEHLTQNCRSALRAALSSINIESLQQIVEEFVELLITASTDSHGVVPTLEVIEFLLQSAVIQRLKDSSFRWRRLLAQVQKAHYKSTDIPRLLTAISVYSWLSDIPSIRQDALKKLFSMLKMIPYPKVRAAVADALFLVTSDEALKGHDWHLPASHNAGVLDEVYSRHVTS
ncbi:hypothetical protein AMS68_004591 [Peltaster fructicola]|uniref:Uncharacterized protein n=1 Tax=Peltaster fructicola TaxID=286661 RepID=A0A6H0XWH1_9PEZI|nr:hypothetical protein AMS68_004591 [Peltaster fructicola]